MLCVSLACRQDVTGKASRIQDLEKAIAEQHRKLEHSEIHSKEYEENLSKLHEQAKLESERGEKLDHALQQCKQEMITHIEQLALLKEQHKHELNSKMTEV